MEDKGYLQKLPSVLSLQKGWSSSRTVTWFIFQDVMVYWEKVKNFLVNVPTSPFDRDICLTTVSNEFIKTYGYFRILEVNLRFTLNFTKSQILNHF